MMVRPAEIRDADILPEIERSAGEVFRSVTELAWVADHEVMAAEAHKTHIAQGTVWVAEDESSRILGFVTAERFGDDLHVWELAVLHDHQRKGVGRRLMRAALDYARARELRALTLTTFRGLPWNEGFYAGLGFRTLDGAEIGHRLATLLLREVQQGPPTETRCAMRMRMGLGTDGRA